MQVKIGDKYRVNLNNKKWHKSVVKIVGIVRGWDYKEIIQTEIIIPNNGYPDYIGQCHYFRENAVKRGVLIPYTTPARNLRQRIKNDKI